MPNSEKLIIEFKVEVVDPLSKFDGSNTNMDEVGMRSTRLGTFKKVCQTAFSIQLNF
ncbi:hypothetical protein [Wolbachia endosymbiont (group B) of Myelois circumvoluta]|uniref:hypothetical protein n=1 Tax=Wolbachia endosymbiont (group B) of Myelois circumvoluta TaxID=3066180 RepID=UPI00376F2964